MQPTRFLLVVGSVIALIAVVLLFGVFRMGEGLAGISLWGERDPEPPVRQQEFLAAVQAAQRVADDANDVQLVQAKIDRDATFCAGVDPSRARAADLAVEDWWGRVEDIRTGMGSDEAELRVRLDHDVELLVDSEVPGDGVQPGTPLYEAVSELEDGEEVLVSGRFVADPDGCLEERSLRLRNSLLTPDFAFVLTRVVPR